MAVSTDNRDFARFLYDAMMFETLPYWTPIAAAAALTSGLFFCIQVCSTRMHSYRPVLSLNRETICVTAPCCVCVLSIVLLMS